jgi:hypothetical protein
VVLRDILEISLGEPKPGEDTIRRPLTVIEARGVGVAEGVVIEGSDA